MKNKVKLFTCILSKISKEYKRVHLLIIDKKNYIHSLQLLI